MPSQEIERQAYAKNEVCSCTQSYDPYWQYVYQNVYNYANDQDTRDLYYDQMVTQSDDYRIYYPGPYGWNPYLRPLGPFGMGYGPYFGAPFFF